MCQVEPNSNNQIGSIANTRDRLLLWANRPIGSLIRAEYASEFARQSVIDQMRVALSDRFIPFHELVLPAQQEPVEVVKTILATIESLPMGVLSVTGFANAFSNKTPLPDAMRVLNFNRDKLVANSLCQIWWMTPVFAHMSLFAMPDITSWFIAKLQLTEHVPIDDGMQPLTEVMSAGGSYANIDDARRRAQNLLQRLQIAKEAGVDDGELLETLLLPALEALAEVGAQKDLRDLSLQFEGMLGQLQIPASPRLCIALGRVANLYFDQGRYAEAEPLFVRSLAISEEQLGANHPSTATSLNNLARLYESTGRYAEAELLFVRSLAISEEQLGANHPSTATSLNNLARLYESTGRYAEAELLFVRSLAISEEQLGANHPSTATSLNNLAELYRGMGRYAEAEPLYVRSLAISEEQLGANHPSTATILNNLAGLYESTGRYAEAEPSYVRSLAIREEQLGANHPDTATSLNNLAGLYESTGRYAEAEPLCVRSLQIAENILGVDHPNTKTIRNNLEILRQQMNSEQLNNSPT
jgi:tetratricopeptide (TPR) repeat protein